MYITYPTGQLAAIRAALALLPAKSQALPESLARVVAAHEAVRAALPPANLGGPGVDLARRLAEVDNPDEAQATLDDLAAEYQRRQLAAHIGGHLSDALAAKAIAAIAEALPELTTRLRPIFDKAAESLTEAATQLPDGEAALDPAAVLASDAESAFRRVRDALTVVRTVGGIHTVTYTADAYTPKGSDLVAVADVPTVTPEPFGGDPEKVTVDEAAVSRTGIRGAVRKYGEGADLALVDIGRGRYRGVSLSLAAGPEDVAARLGRVASAHTLRRVEPAPMREAG